MTRRQLEQRAVDLEQAIANGAAQRQQLLQQADKIAMATVRLEGRLAEIQELLRATRPKPTAPAPA